MGLGVVRTHGLDTQLFPHGWSNVMLWSLEPDVTVTFCKFERKFYSIPEQAQPTFY